VGQGSAEDIVAALELPTLQGLTVEVAA